MIFFPSSWSSVSFFCLFVPPCPSTLSCARYTFSLNARIVGIAALIFFCLLILYFCPFLHECVLRLLRNSHPGHMNVACVCLKVSRRMTNCKYSSFRKAIYKTQKSFNKHYFLCRFSRVLLYGAHHRNGGLLCVYLINNNSLLFHSSVVST